MKPTTIAAALLVASAAITGCAEHTADAARPAALYGWKEVKRETFELTALATREIAAPNAGRFRVSAQAASGISFGFVAGKTLDNVRASAGRISANQIDLQTAPCADAQIIEGSAECESKMPGQKLLVQDERQAISVIAAAIAGIGKDRIAAGNRVAIKIEMWDCIANCPIGKTSTQATAK